MGRINLFTIPAGLSFADELARGVVARFGSGDDPLALARVLILLPTRRAIRTLSEAFARVSPTGVSVIPRMRALGDFDESDPDADETPDEAFDSSVPSGLDEPLKALRRDLLLTLLIQRWSRQQAEGGRSERIGAESPALALRLGRDLAVLLDQATAEGLDWRRLEGLVPAELAGHWSQTITFLEILTASWPQILIDQKASDPAAHRDAALRAAAAAWAESPPDHPVIAAGSTGSMPATALLLKTIAHLPQGAVVLPGVDLELDAESWASMGPGHPQFGMRQLIAGMGVTREAVLPWGGAAVNAARVRLIAEALRPAETTPQWQDFVAAQRTTIEAGLNGLTSIVARTPSEEALAIACALREAIEVPGKTAALITPDRNLARRVASELRRWGVSIDDSAGVPLPHTVPGRFLSLVADAAAEEFAPVPLLAMLKHPLAALGFDRRVQARQLTTAFEAKVLRGIRPAPGLASLRSLGDPKEPWFAIIEKLEAAFGAFAAMMAAGSHDLRDLVRAHRETAGLLAMDGRGEDGGLWDREAGEAADATLRELDDAAAEIGLAMSGPDYAAFIRTVMEGVPVRPHMGQHPRLSILGPLEARLQRADLMILGGLNEGKWPPATDPGPWLNRPMRDQLGLSQPERRVGLSAHDFAQAAAAPEVILSRAEKDGGAPTTPSRWLTRLNMLVAGAKLDHLLAADRLLEIARKLDQPGGAATPVAPPAPCPPVTARPRSLHVTDVEKWVRDPYALYARRILCLKRLDPLDEEPGAAERGTNIHKALELFVEKYPRALPLRDEAMAALEEMGLKAFGKLLERPGVRSFWWPRYLRVAAWFFEHELQRRQDVTRVLAEQKGEIEIDAPAGTFKLGAKADRIDVMTDGSAVIVDYKTGTPPSGDQVKTGLSPQLTLEAAMLLQGGFPNVQADSIRALEYMQLSGGAEAGKLRTVFKADAATAAALDALARFKAYVAAFDQPDMPYLSKPHVLLERHAGDYDHLARVKEWGSEGGE